MFSILVDYKNKFKMNRIKEVLEPKGIKQILLVEQAGMSYNMIHSYAQNKRSLEDLHKIAKILNVESKELLLSIKELN